MIDMTEVRSATDTLARAFEEYKSVNDQRLAEIEHRGSADILHDEKLGRMDGTINRLQDDITEPENLAAPSVRQAMHTLNGYDSAHKKAFMKYIAKGNEVGICRFRK